MASLGICISKIVNVAAADTPSSYLKSSGGLALKELPGLNLTPRSTSLFNSDFELSSRPEYQTCSSQQEINVFERSFAPTIDEEVKDSAKLALKAAILATEPTTLPESGLITYHDFPTSRAYKALISPPLPLYEQHHKRSHFTIPLRGHADRNAQSSLAAIEPTPGAIPQAVSEAVTVNVKRSPFDLPSADELRRIKTKWDARQRALKLELAELITAPPETADVTFRLPYRSSELISYVGYCPRLVQYSIHSSPQHSYAQMLLFVNYHLSALDLDSKPNLHNVYARNMFYRPYFGISRLSDGHLHRTLSTQRPQQTRWPNRQQASSGLASVAPSDDDGSSSSSSSSLSLSFSDGIPQVYCAFLEEAQQRLIGRYFEDIQCPADLERKKMELLTPLGPDCGLISGKVFQEPAYAGPPVQGLGLKYPDYLLLSRNHANEMLTLPELSSHERSRGDVASETSVALGSSAVALGSSASAVPASTSASIRCVSSKRRRLESEPLREEPSRREKILERNRVAASRSRQKKKREIESTIGVLSTLEEQCRHNCQIFLSLKTQHDVLFSKLLDHQPCGCVALETFDKLRGIYNK